MRVLIACEESQTVCKAFRERGHEAYSNDLIPCSGGHPEWHLHMDCFEAIALGGWDMMIAHPPCTYLTVTGNKWFKPEYFDRFPGRYMKRVEAAKFFIQIIESDIEKIAVENPVGVMNSFYRQLDQIIQPYYFGHKEPKKTCLWLKNLPKLQYVLTDDLFDKSNYCEPEYTVTKSGKNMATWYYYAEKVKGDSNHRAKIRSTFFPGIARAMAEQWGSL